MTPDQIKQLLWNAFWAVWGKAPSDSDNTYWIGIYPALVQRGQELNDPNYPVKRMMGYESGGSDIPPYGPYSNPPKPDFSPIPPYPGTAPVPSSTPNSGSSDPNSVSILTTISNKLDTIIANQQQLQKTIADGAVNVETAIKNFKLF